LTLIDPYHVLEKSLERIRHDEIDGVTYKQAMRDFKSVEKLRSGLKEQDNKPDASWFKQAEKLRTYSQELGLTLRRNGNQTLINPMRVWAAYTLLKRHFKGENNNVRYRESSAF